MAKARAKTKTRHPLARIIDEVVRLKGRLQTVFSDARISTGLSVMETMVLTAVVEANHPPTVSQIGRSLGHPRQVVQRAANSLIDARLLETATNPEHKRAQLLHATTAGRKLYADAEVRARRSADQLAKVLGLSECERMARDLHELRNKIEAYLRSTGAKAKRTKPHS